jgi:F-type H+-transporting ATPase subunit epsilon
VIVLADTAIRGHDLDEAKAVEAKKRAEEAMQNRAGDFDIAHAQSEFAMAAAQLAAISRLRRKK